MGQISASSIVSNIGGVSAAGAGSPLPSEDRAVFQAVSNAVRTLNEAGYAGEGREVAFSVDPASRKPVVKVVDTATREIIAQWPSAYALQLAAQPVDTTERSI